MSITNSLHCAHKKLLIGNYTYSNTISTDCKLWKTELHRNHSSFKLERIFKNVITIKDIPNNEAMRMNLAQVAKCQTF